MTATAPEGAATKDQGQVIQSDGNSSALLAAALDYVTRRNWPVFPCCSDPCDGSPHGRAQCDSPGKAPLTRHGFKDATRDPDQICAWWEQWPNANIGIPTGAASGFIVLDQDNGHEGENTLNWLAASHGPIPNTLTVRTPGNPAKGKGPGRHIYVRHPGGKVKNSAGKLGSGLDVRGDGGYVIAPPSRLLAGPYTVEDDGPVRALRPAWHDLLRGGEQAPEPSSNGDQPEQSTADPFVDPPHPFTREQAKAHIEQHALTPLRAATEPGRNVQLNDSTTAFWHFIPGFWSAAEATETLAEIAKDIGLDDGEIAATIASGLGGPSTGRWKAELVEDEEPATAPSRRVNLRPYLDGTYVPPKPSVGGERTDGACLLYPGRWHTVIALTAAGKSWLALWHALAALRAGGIVVYLHFEEASPALMIGRLRALGMDADILAERFVWLDCSTRWTREQIESELDSLPAAPALVVLDGINAACSQHGWHPNDDGSVGAYRLTFEKPATRLGAAVLSLGHPPKAPDRQSERHGYGATGWLDQADGVGFRMEMTRTPLRRGSVVHLVFTPSRTGTVRSSGRASLRGGMAGTTLASSCSMTRASRSTRTAHN